MERECTGPKAMRMEENIKSTKGIGSVSHIIMVGTVSSVVGSDYGLPRARAFMFPPGVSEMLRARPLDSSVQLERVVILRATSWIISPITRLFVNRKDGLGALIPDPWREWTMGELGGQVGVVLAIGKVRDG